SALARFSSMVPQRPSSALLPYTPLFRSRQHLDTVAVPVTHVEALVPVEGVPLGPADVVRRESLRQGLQLGDVVDQQRRVRLGGRSEEHTSELQSRENLVCRLLLEKKKHH